MTQNNFLDYLLKIAGGTVVARFAINADKYSSIPKVVKAGNNQEGFTFISGAFSWEDSPEGFTYWAGVNDIWVKDIRSEWHRNCNE